MHPLLITPTKTQDIRSRMSGGILTGIYNAGKETFGVERQYTAGPNQRWAARKTLTITSRSGVALSAATEWQKQHGGGAKSPGTPRAGLGPPGMGAATRVMFGAAASFRPMLGLVGWVDPGLEP